MRGSRVLKLVDRVVGPLAVLLLWPFLRRGRRGAEGAAGAPPRKALVVKLAALGDTLLLMPVVRALRARHGDLEVVMVGTAINAAVPPLLGGAVDRFIEVDPGRLMRSPRALLRLVRALRAERFDLALDFEQWAWFTPLVVLLCGAPLRAGFAARSRVRELAYTHTVARRPERHEAENFHALARLLDPPGGTALDPAPELELAPAPGALGSVRARLEEAGFSGARPLVVIHPGCGAHGFPREWPLDSYRRLAERLAASHDPFFVFTGTGAEEELTRALASHVPGRSLALGARSLDESIALASLASLFVSGNNGAMHLAAAVRAPQIALHGPTDSVKWGPRNPRARVIRSPCPGCPCLDLGFEYHRTDGACMAAIPVEEVHAAAAEMLGPREARIPSPEA